VAAGKWPGGPLVSNPKKGKKEKQSEAGFAANVDGDGPNRPYYYHTLASHGMSQTWRRLTMHDDVVACEGVLLMAAESQRVGVIAGKPFRWKGEKKKKKERK
jgi:hypothetical protein